MNIIETMMNNVKRFLSLKQNKNFLTFLFFLAFAAIFWFMMALNETYEHEVAIPVKITGVPSNIVLTSEETDTVCVTLSDKGLVLVGYFYWNTPKTIEIDFHKYATGLERVVVPASDLQQMITNRLSASTKVLNFSPSEEFFFFNYGISKRVPVRKSGIVKPQQPYFIAEEIIFPDSVDLFASQHLLDSINEVFTEPLNYVDFRDTLTVSASLQRIKGVKAVPNGVKMSFTTDILTEGSLGDIPVRGMNMPAGTVLRTFPSKVTVHFVTGMRNLRSIKPDDFAVVVDYNEITTNPSEKCRIRLITVPETVSRASLDITQADYLIEE